METFLQDVRVQREPSAEAAANVLEHFRIAHESVGIDRGHRAASPQRVEADDRASDVELGARQRWVAAVESLADQGWPLVGSSRRWRHGEVTVRWSAVAPVLPGR